ncbi:MAG: divalent metal cation transporter [Abditibacteriota bacterium]|nr:divalent metal cation transporter [Abditibacteriota bacterium]
MMRRLKRSRLFLFLAVMGPGLITSAADNDAGGIITYIQTGAKHRYDLLWVIFLLTIVLAMIQEMCARMGCVTQKGLGELIRENFGVKWTMFALGTLLIANLRNGNATMGKATTHSTSRHTRVVSENLPPSGGGSEGLASEAASVPPATTRGIFTTSPLAIRTIFSSPLRTAELFVVSN